MLELLKRSWILPLIVIMVALLVVIKKYDFSLTDHIADRVIEKLDADYSPYGPNVTPEAKETPDVQPEAQPEVQPEQPQEPDVGDSEKPEANRKPWLRPWQRPNKPS